MHRTLIFISLAAASLMALADTPQKQTVMDVKHTITDNNIVFPESYETDTRKMMEDWYLKNYTATDDKYIRREDTNPDDRTVSRRLAALPTKIEMPYNQIVRSYIDRYTKRGREQVATLLGLSIYYMPVFEQALEERGLPLELKYLPIIESGLDPNAVSKHGATGLWQFMIATAKGLGLEVNSLVDERRDPYAASEKAADYLQSLYNTYGDWSLAIAAYNCGPGTVNKAIRRAGGDPKSHDFWSIYNYLSPETRGYVPMFIAANYVMNYYPEHNISPVLSTKPLVTDTLRISDRVHFEQIAGVIDIPVDELRILNPQFRADIIPGTAEKPYNLILPSQQVHAYILSENAIKEFEAEKYARREVVEPSEMPADAVIAEAEMDNAPVEEQLTATQPAAVAKSTGKSVTHKVKAGETLADIAAKYKVAEADIKAWNNLRRNAVRTGQVLRINTAADSELSDPSQTDRTYAPAKTVAPAREKTQSQTAAAPQTTKKKQQAEKQKKNAQPTTHSIKSGENLTTIARKYGVTVDELKKANNIKDDNVRAGDQLKVPAKGAASSKSSKSKSGSKKKRRR